MSGVSRRVSERPAFGGAVPHARPRRALREQRAPPFVFLAVPRHHRRDVLTHVARRDPGHLQFSSKKKKSGPSLRRRDHVYAVPDLAGHFMAIERVRFKRGRQKIRGFVRYR